LLWLRRKNLSFKALRVLHSRTQLRLLICLLLSFWLVGRTQQMRGEHVRLLEGVGTVEDLDEVLFAISGMLLKIDVILAILVMRSIFRCWRRQRQIPRQPQRTIMQMVGRRMLQRLSRVVLVHIERCAPLRVQQLAILPPRVLRFNRGSLCIERIFSRCVRIWWHHVVIRRYQMLRTE
jgi:hypothetical protein